MEERVLADLRVIDLSHFVAGPYCTKLLADFGAEVIKVEKPGQGDGARTLGPFCHDDPHPEKSGLFLYLNTNKKSITLNLKTETGVGILKQLVTDADILVENFEPRVMPSLGLSYEVLKQMNPKLVMTSISNFGQTGPYRDYKATSMTMFAMGGAMAITGDEHRPLSPWGSQAEYMAGLVGFQATMIAIFPSRLEQSQIRFMDSSRGRDKVLFGTNGLGLKRCKEEFMALPIRDETKRMVFRENNIKFLKLE